MGEVAELIYESDMGLALLAPGIAVLRHRTGVHGYVVGWRINAHLWSVDFIECRDFNAHPKQVFVADIALRCTWCVADVASTVRTTCWVWDYPGADNELVTELSLHTAGYDPGWMQLETVELDRDGAIRVLQEKHDLLVVRSNPRAAGHATELLVWRTHSGVAFRVRDKRLWLLKLEGRDRATVPADDVFFGNPAAPHGAAEGSIVSCELFTMWCDDSPDTEIRWRVCDTQVPVQAVDSVSSARRRVGASKSYHITDRRSMAVNAVCRSRDPRWCNIYRQMANAHQPLPPRSAFAALKLAESEERKGDNVRVLVVGRALIGISRTTTLVRSVAHAGNITHDVTQDYKATRLRSFKIAVGIWLPEYEGFLTKWLAVGGVAFLLVRRGCELITHHPLIQRGDIGLVDDSWRLAVVRKLRR